MLLPNQGNPPVCVGSHQHLFLLLPLHEFSKQRFGFFGRWFIPSSRRNRARKFGNSGLRDCGLGKPHEINVCRVSDAGPWRWCSLRRGRRPETLHNRRHAPRAPTQPRLLPHTGIVISKMEPSESDLTSRSLPPWFSTAVRQIASPKPIPSDLVVKNGSNKRS